MNVDTNQPPVMPRRPLLLLHAADFAAPSPYVVSSVQQLVAEGFIPPDSPEYVCVHDALYHTYAPVIVARLADLRQVLATFGPVDFPPRFISDPSTDASQDALQAYLQSARPDDHIRIELAP